MCQHEKKRRNDDANIGDQAEDEGPGPEIRLEWSSFPPTIVVVFPIVAILCKIPLGLTWTPRNIILGQVFVVLLAVMAVLGVLYVRHKIEKSGKRNRQRTIWVDVKSFPQATKEQKQKKHPVEVSIYEYEMAKIPGMLLPVGIGVLAALLLPTLVQINRPIILQSIVIPASFFRERLVQYYILHRKVAKTSKLPFKKIKVK